MYLAVNKVNGKSYVGVTRLELSQRMSLHFNASIKDKCKHQKFARAIVKYGRENFHASIIGNFDTFKKALAAEIVEIERRKPEYNITKGGEGTLGYRHSAEKLAEIKKKLKGREGPMKGIPRSIATREKIGASVRKNHARYWLGKSRSQDTINKIKIKKTGIKRYAISKEQAEIFAENMRRAARNRRKKVICVNDGMVFDSVSSSADHYGINKTTVSSICLGKRSQTRHGLIVRFHEQT